EAPAEQVSRHELPHMSEQGALDAHPTLQPEPHEKSQDAPAVHMKLHWLVQLSVQPPVQVQVLPVAQLPSGPLVPLSLHAAASPTASASISSGGLTASEYQLPGRPASFRIPETRGPRCPRPRSRWARARPSPP